VTSPRPNGGSVSSALGLPSALRFSPPRALASCCPETGARWAEQEQLPARAPSPTC